MLTMSKEDLNVFYEEWKSITDKLKNSGHDLKKIKIAKTRETDRY